MDVRLLDSNRNSMQMQLLLAVEDMDLDKYLYRIEMRRDRENFRSNQNPTMTNKQRIERKFEETYLSNRSIG